MCKMKSIFGFFRNGAKVFRLAAHGEYQENAEEMRRIEDEVMCGTSWRDDKANLQGDWKNVRGDMRKAWGKIESSNG